MPKLVFTGVILVNWIISILAYSFGIVKYLATDVFNADYNKYTTGYLLISSILIGIVNVYLVYKHRRLFNIIIAAFALTIAFLIIAFRCKGAISGGVIG